MIPFRRLPGPVIVSKATEEVLNDITNEVLERLDMVGVQVEAAELSNCKERVMLLQTCIFIDLERMHGPRGTSITERQRYNLKAFTGPIIDFLTELRADYYILPLVARYIKIYQLKGLFERLFYINDPLLY